jgi:pimeloyl-ACP methyl ester carboxylesterase
MAGTLTKEQTDRFAEVKGIRIHYNEAGRGPALICTHGGGPGANAWANSRHVFDALAEHFHVFLMDMPGFGESQKDVKLNGERMDFFCARLMRDFLDSQGIERTHLYGSSAFSASPLRFGIEYPQRVGKIIVQAYSPGEVLHETEGLKSLVAFAQNPTRENMQRMMELFIPNEKLRPESLIDARFKAALSPGHLEARREFSARNNSDLGKDIDRLRAEVLVVWGKEDRMIPVEGAFTALKRIPNVRVHVWGGNSGHFVAYEHAEEFSRLVIDFLTH